MQRRLALMLTCLFGLCIAACGGQAVEDDWATSVETDTFEPVAGTEAQSNNGSSGANNTRKSANAGRCYELRDASNSCSLEYRKRCTDTICSCCQ